MIGKWKQECLDALRRMVKVRQVIWKIHRASQSPKAVGSYSLPIVQLLRRKLKKGEEVPENNQAKRSAEKTLGLYRSILFERLTEMQYTDSEKSRRGHS